MAALIPPTGLEAGIVRKRTLYLMGALILLLVAAVVAAAVWLAVLEVTGQ